jgi:hypothetical protein
VVGVSPSTTIATSTNGVDWTPSSTNPFSGVGAEGGQGIAWNNSYWVAVGANADLTVCIAKSSNGSTWTDSSNNPFDGGIGRGIAWNGSYWVAVGNNTDSIVCIATSTDGLTWTDSSNNPFLGGSGRGIAWNGSYWVAVGNNADFTVTIATSTNGSVWTPSINNPNNGSSTFGVAVGNVAISPVLSLGTTVTAEPSVSELNMAINGHSASVSALINKRPVLTSQVVTSLTYDDFYNGTTNIEGYNIYDAMTSAIKLKLGYTGTLTPALAGAMRGYIYEVIVFNTEIGVDERQAIEGYLAWKWGIQDLLVDTHPYYLAPP